MLIYDPKRENFDLFSGSYFLRTYQRNASHPLIKNLMNEGFSILSDRCRPVETENNPNSPFFIEGTNLSSRDSWALSNWTARSIPPEKIRCSILVDQFRFSQFLYRTLKGRWKRASHLQVSLLFLVLPKSCRMRN